MPTYNNRIVTIHLLNSYYHLSVFLFYELYSVNINILLCDYKYPIE